jgi:hypothetical protein
MSNESSAVASARSVLSNDQVELYRREGYLIRTDPLFPERKFEALKSHFEEKLARLPENVRPEAMDVPHFTDTKLFDWLFSDEVLDVVEPIIGPDIALFSSHFICKPRGNGKRVPWHEDGYYWSDMMQPMDVCTVWLAIDPSLKENGCMNVIPRSHLTGFSEYEPADLNTNVFWIQIKKGQFDESLITPIELKPNQASLHDARTIHGSDPNTSTLRRCGYTMRYISTAVKFNTEKYGQTHNIYLARGRDIAGNEYSDPTKVYEEKAQYRETHQRGGH